MFIFGASNLLTDDDYDTNDYDNNYNVDDNDDNIQCWVMIIYFVYLFMKLFRAFLLNQWNSESPVFSLK